MIEAKTELLGMIQKARAHWESLLAEIPAEWMTEPGVEGAQQRRWLERLDASSGWRTPWLHMLAVAALTVVVSLILYTVAVLEYPFDGSLRVKPEAFESGSRKTRARR